MALAPNSDLLLTQSDANEISKLIALWDDYSPDEGLQGDLIVQAPLDPTRENMRHHQDLINPMERNRAALTHMSDVPGTVSRNTELKWLIPSMSPILQTQGTNIRALV